jgi:SAM-dependent methyltransferase
VNTSRLIEATSTLAVRARLSLRRHGVFGSARLAVGRALMIRSQARKWGAERDFDRYYDVDTRGIVPLELLQIPSANKASGFKYGGSDPDLFRMMVGRLPLEHEKFVFIDFGSGKGRALVLASEFPFKRVVGVEFSPKLHEIAKKNIERLDSSTIRCRAIESVCEDATRFDIPADPAVLYFYNPFGIDVMRQVMGRVNDSLTRSKRDIFIVVTGGSPLADLAEEMGFTRLDLPSLSLPSGGAPAVLAATSPESAE